MEVPAESIPRLHERLLAWFERARRDLPWRDDRTPYRVWVSEIMLQQTRVETVVPYFERWMRSYPTVDALAEASEDAVLKSWEGLGYYSRARNLHRAAKVVREHHAGELPDSAAELRELPGVGEYTSGAIASLAFGEVVPAVDGNVRRVFSRWFDVGEPTTAELRRVATELVSPERPGDWNEALMEFGATVCVPRAPRCDVCPLGDLCGAYRAGTVELRPAPKKKTRQREAVFAVVVPMRADGSLLVVRRPPTGLLAGMWEFPQAEVPSVSDPESIVSAVTVGRFGLRPTGAPPTALEPVDHVFSHIRARYAAVLLEVEGEPGGPDSVWLRMGEATDLALPVAQQRIRELAERASGRLDSPADAL